MSLRLSTDGTRATLSVLATLILLTTPAGVSAKTTWKTKVDGTTFRITLDDGVLNVVDKSILTGRSMDIRDKMRAAVLQATGCEITDELWFDAKLKGKFNCPAGQMPKPPNSKPVD